MFDETPSMTNAHDENGFLIDTQPKIVAAGTGDSGIEYFKFSVGDRSTWLPRSTCSPDLSEAITCLKRRDMFVTGSKSRAAIMEHVEAINRFPPINIIEHPGHFNGSFGHPDGHVFTAGAEAPPIAYPIGLVCVESRGKRKEWKREVMGLLCGQHVPIFAVLMALAAPLLSRSGIQGNYIIMFSGPPRKGKSTTIAAAASVCGPAMDSESGRRYLRRFNQTINRLEEQLPLYRDMPMIIDELSSFGTQRSRMEQFRTLVHHLAGGDERERFGDGSRLGSHIRTIVQITSNDKARELLCLESEDAMEAVIDRLIEIRLPRGDEGAFNWLPKGFASTEALATEIAERLGRYYGTAMPRFLRRLIKHMAERGKAFDGELRERIEEFRALPAVRRFGPVSSRVLNLFGLAYATGRLARWFKVLPKSIDVEAAVVHCLGLHLGERAEIDPVQQLLGWISTHHVYDLRSGRLPALSDKSFKKRGAFILDGRSGPQFLMNTNLFRATFHEPLNLMRKLHAMGILLAEGKGKNRHYPIKRFVRSHKGSERVLAFHLPDFDEWLEQNNMPCPPKRRK